MMAGAFPAGAELLGHRQAYASGNLLRAQKVLVRGTFEIITFQRDDALVPGGIRSLVHRHGKMAVAQQLTLPGRARGNSGSDAFRVEPGAGAYLVRSRVVDDQHPHRAVALRLQDKATIELERRSEQDGEHGRLAEQLCHRSGIAMT